MLQSLNIAFVVWRESVEALLVIGVLNAWLTHQPTVLRLRGRVWLWSGVAMGCLGALFLAYLLLFTQDALDETLQEYFQTAIVFLASFLIVQMVFWMRKHSRTLKNDLHASLDHATGRANYLGVFTLAALAVLREGAEAAIFLFGAMTSASSSLWSTGLAAGIGLAAAFGAYALLQAGNKYLSWRVFFRITEIMLLWFGCALFLSGIDHLIALDIAPTLSERLWDTSYLLPDSGPWGGLLANLTGYRAKPVLTELLAFVFYWVIIGILFRRSSSETRA